MVQELLNIGFFMSNWPENVPFPGENAKDKVRSKGLAELDKPHQLALMVALKSSAHQLTFKRIESSAISCE